MGHKWGNYTKTVLPLIFSWGIERGFMANNPAFKVKGLKGPKSAVQANRPWQDSEREAVLTALPSHMTVPFSLMMSCGLDPIDVVRLFRESITEGFIDTNRAKTSEQVWIPLPAPVREAVANASPHTAITVCANSHGKPWTTDGLDSNWQKIRKKLLNQGCIRPGLTLKGLAILSRQSLPGWDTTIERLLICLAKNAGHGAALFPPG